MRMTRVLLWALLATIVAMIFLPFVVNYLPGVWLQPDAILGGGLLTLAYLIVALGCAVALENGRAPRLMRSGIIVGAVALAGWFAVTVVNPPFDVLVEYHRVLIWPTCWPCLMMVIGLLLLPKSHLRSWTIMRGVAMALLALLALEICLAFTFYPGPTSYFWKGTYYDYDEIAIRVGGALALLAAGAVVITFLTAWIPRFAGTHPVETRRYQYWLRCPRCGHEQQAQTGIDACAGCNLRIRVELA